MTGCWRLGYRPVLPGWEQRNTFKKQVDWSPECGPSIGNCQGAEGFPFLRGTFARGRWRNHFQVVHRGGLNTRDHHPGLLSDAGGHRSWHRKGRGELFWPVGWASSPAEDSFVVTKPQPGQDRAGHMPPAHVSLRSQFCSHTADE